MRTKGSFSFVKIPTIDIVSKYVDAATAASLVAQFPGLRDETVCSRKWAEGRGFTGLVSGPAANTFASIAGQTPETVVRVVDLND